MPSTATPLILSDPGFLFWAPGGTVIPTMVAAASKFTDAWPVAWINMGATEEGSTFTFSTTVEPITVAEILNPISYPVTGQASKIAFSLADFTLKSLQRAWNGVAPTTVSGTGATLVSKLSPPTPAQIVRAAIGWESLDGTLRMIGQQAINGAEIASAFQRAPNNAVIPCEFNFEIMVGNTTGFDFYAAGTGRLGV